MDILILTQNTSKITGPIAKWILGPIMNAIFNFLNWIKIPNIGLAIILFTIVIYLLLMPLTIKQQKFSKLQAKIQPELNAIQKKYKDRKDQDAQIAMSQETKAVYDKYGVSPTGSCVQLLIQMPILFALYRVIYSVPAYVTKVKDAFIPLVSELVKQDGAKDFIQQKENFSNSAQFIKQFQNDLFINGDPTYVQNTFIDVLNRASTSEWEGLKSSFSGLADLISNTQRTIEHYNNFLGINIGNSPSYTIKDAWASGRYIIVLGAILIPVLSAVTQWLNTKLIPTANSNQKTGNDQADQMASSMKAMNTFMPLFSAFMCFTLPAGLGIYWIAGSVVRSIQQVVINKYIDKMDLEEEIKKNIEKRNKKLAKKGIDPSKISQNANRSTKAMERLNQIKAENEAKVQEAQQKSAKAGSIASKAQLVKQYNEKNNNK